MVNYADEEFLGSFAAIASALVSFSMKTNLLVYIRIAEALEELDSPQPAGTPGATGTLIMEVNNRVQTMGVDITDEELDSVSLLVKGHMLVEVLH